MADTDTLLTVRLPGAEIADLDRLARAKGYSRSELVRRLLRRGIKYADEIPPRDVAGAVRPVAVAVA